MGLDAAVYARDDPDHERAPRCLSQLGNIAAIPGLREELSRLGAGEGTHLQRLCLYSGSHCGDAIPLDSLDELEREIETFLSRALGDGAAFLNSLLVLVKAAKQENTSIIFV